MIMFSLRAPFYSVLVSCPRGRTWRDLTFSGWFLILLEEESSTSFDSGSSNADVGLLIISSVAQSPRIHDPF